MATTDKINKTLLGEGKRSFQSKEKPENRAVDFKPRTDFGKRLLKLRREIENSDAKLLNENEVSIEVLHRRGGQD